MQKIYTKKGDKGQTSLLGGTRILKCDMKIDSYGNVDELNAHIGFIRDSIELTSLDANGNIGDQLLTISRNLFVIGSLLSCDSQEQIEKYSLKCINEDDVNTLEKDMDNMAKELSPLKKFILPGGHPLVSSVHICRTVCRRAERSIVSLSQTEEIDLLIIKYVNRLSDYLFVLSRYFSHLLRIPEILWN